MIELFFLWFALAMDSFAVSIWLWVKNKKAHFLLIIKIALFFWIFQWIMPLLWHFLSVWIGWYIETIDHWIAFLLLWCIWGKMLYESFQGDEENEKNEENQKMSNKMLLLLAIATSIDAMAAWFTLNLLTINPYISVISIWIITFILCILWVMIGKKWWEFLESKAEILWWTILIILWIKILLQHTM